MKIVSQKSRKKNLLEPSEILVCWEVVLWCTRTVNKNTEFLQKNEMLSEKNAKKTHQLEEICNVNKKYYVQSRVFFHSQLNIDLRINFVKANIYSNIVKRISRWNHFFVNVSLQLFVSTYFINKHCCRNIVEKYYCFLFIFFTTYTVCILCFFLSHNERYINHKVL